MQWFAIPVTGPVRRFYLVTIEDFGGWVKAQPEHFGDGGIFDKIYQ